MRAETLSAGSACLTAAIVALCACAPQGGMESGPGAAADTVEGTVRQVGNTPFVRTVVAGEDASVTIAGDLSEELARAAGARVRAWGRYAEDGGPGRELQAEGYEIVAVDGVEPTVGILRDEPPRGYYIETGGGDEVSVSGVPGGLEGQAGAKIWAVLGEHGGIQRYGILREP